jgi:hypothetical protein
MHVCHSQLTKAWFFIHDFYRQAHFLQRAVNMNKGCSEIRTALIDSAAHYVM